MTSRHISTNIHLPPGPPATAVVRELLRLAFEKYRWFKPAPDKYLGWDARLAPGRADYSVLLEHYGDAGNLSLADRRQEDFLMISSSRRTPFPFVGKITWAVTIDDSKMPGWLDEHLWQVVELMRMVGSPLAQAGLSDDLNRKKERFIPNPDGLGTEQTFTLRDPSEGLTGLMWRNFFGAPFIRMFGDRLQLLPPSSQRELGSDLILVQPYELPTQAMTPEGDAAEERLITVLGPECFYDHQQHRKPTRVPELVASST